MILTSSSIRCLQNVAIAFRKKVPSLYICKSNTLCPVWYKDLSPQMSTTWLTFKGHSSLASNMNVQYPINLGSLLSILGSTQNLVCLEYLVRIWYTKSRFVPIHIWYFMMTRLDGKKHTQTATHSHVFNTLRMFDRQKCKGLIKWKNAFFQTAWRTKWYHELWCYW